MRQRGKDSWAITVEMGKDPSTGERRQLFETVKGKRKAQTRLAELIVSARTGYALRPERITLAEYLDSWLAGYATTNTRPRTALGYASKLHLYIIPRMGKVTLRNLEPRQIQGAYKALLDKGLSARSVLHTHRVLREALEHAVMQGYIARNPCQAVTPPRPERKTMRWLNAQELQRVLEGAKGTSYYAVIFTALYTGLRRGELLGLRLRDVDLTMGTLYVSQALSTLPGGMVVFSEPKTQQGRRSVALTPSNAILLRDHIDWVRVNMDMIGLPMADDTLIFGWANGQPMQPNSLSRAWRRIVRSVGLPGVSLHDARHTHASLMLQQNIPSKGGSGEVRPFLNSDHLGHLQPRDAWNTRGSGHAV